MLTLLSPAKNLDFTPAPFELPLTQPILGDETQALTKVTAKLSRKQIARLMDLSDNLADLNWHRFQALAAPLQEDETRQAILAFNGDVYQGLGARALAPEDLNWAQDHVRILSGLYGLLRPLDAIAPYRLEMGTALKTKRGRNLYQFWGQRLSKALMADLTDHKTPAIINLASQEYAGAIDRKAVSAPVITCHFKEVRDGQARVLGFFAKRARGLMAQFIIDNRIEEPDALKGFQAEGYCFDKAQSTQTEWVFTRPQPPAKGA
ncbi:MAG: hypothetical protein RL186_1732 [Pseudomonadota bacterium]